MVILVSNTYVIIMTKRFTLIRLAIDFLIQLNSLITIEIQLNRQSVLDCIENNPGSCSSYKYKQDHKSESFSLIVIGLNESDKLVEIETSCLVPH